MDQLFKILKERVFIIAELSANHNGSPENALNTVKAAKRAGADAIKLQTYTPDTITIDCEKDDFKIKGNSIYVCTEHTPDIIDRYFQALEPVFSEIKEFEHGKDILQRLNGLVCHGEFKRLN